jgi:hypothetical protein
VHGRREDTRQDADVAAARHDAPEVEDELGWVVDDVREVHVNAVCDRVVDRELKSLGLWGLGLGRLIGHGDTSHFLGTPLRKRHASIVEVMRRLAVLFCLPALLAASEPVPKPADIDRLWALRAEGSTGGRALSSPIDLTIDACRAVLAAEPESLEARWRLMRALYFKGEHTTDDPTAKRTLFDEGRTVAEQALAVLRREAGREAHRNLAKATPVELVAYVKGNAAAVPSFLWAAVDWGKWALVFGKTAAVRQGAAAKIRDYAEAVILLDPAYDSGGGYRVLGRLHHQTPAVPFFTGWASRSEALKNLRLAVEVGTHNLVGRQFLAEAMWDYEPARRAEARAMLQKILAEALDPDFLVENRKTQEEAAQLLKDWAGR